MRYFTYLNGVQVGAQTSRKIAMRDAERICAYVRPGIRVIVEDQQTGFIIFDRVP